MDSGLRSTAISVSRQTNIFTMVIRIVDTPGKHRDLIRQEITSVFHELAGISASTRMISIKQSAKRNCLWLHQLTKTQQVSPTLLWVKTSSMENSKNHQWQNLPTTSSQGGMKFTLCWNSHCAPNSKTWMLIL
jgi:hypothetical protein